MDMVDVLMLVATLKFEPFTKSDYMAFSGVTSEHPMIAYTDDLTIIVDGEEIEVIDSLEGFTVVIAKLSER
jgi:hypothetical protein